MEFGFVSAPKGENTEYTRTYLLDAATIGRLAAAGPFEQGAVGGLQWSARRNVLGPRSMVEDCRITCSSATFHRPRKLRDGP